MRETGSQQQRRKNVVRDKEKVILPRHPTKQRNPCKAPSRRSLRRARKHGSDPIFLIFCPVSPPPRPWRNLPDPADEPANENPFSPAPPHRRCCPHTELRREMTCWRNSEKKPPSSRYAGPRNQDIFSPVSSRFSDICFSGSLFMRTEHETIRPAATSFPSTLCSPEPFFFSFNSLVTSVYFCSYTKHCHATHSLTRPSYSFFFIFFLFLLCLRHPITRSLDRHPSLLIHPTHADTGRQEEGR